MKIIFLVLCVSTFISCVNTVQPKYFSKGYLDSTKSFFNTYASDHSNLSEYIIQDYSQDKAPQNIYTGIVDWVSRFPERSACKVNRLKYITTKYRESSVIEVEEVDTISINEDEVKLITQQLKESKYLRIPNDFFPNSKVVNTYEIDSVAQIISRAGLKFQTRTFSLPVFLRNGKFAVCYGLYADNQTSMLELIVYVNEKGDWTSFGDKGLMIWDTRKFF